MTSALYTARRRYKRVLRILAERRARVSVTESSRGENVSNSPKMQLDELSPVQFERYPFDPNLPVTFRRDKLDKEAIAGKESMGILASPASSAAAVVIILDEYQKVCPSRDLALQSRYFRRHLSRYPTPREHCVPGTIPVAGLDAALRFMGTEAGIDVVVSNLATILCAAARLEIPVLQRRLEQYLRAVSKLDTSYFLVCWELCRYAPASVQLREEMLSRASVSFLRLPDQPNWPLLNSRLVRKLFLRPELKSLPAVTIFEAALAWITGNPKVAPPDLDRVIAAVPFKRMCRIDIMKCLAKAEEMQLIGVIAPRVTQSSWYQVCLDSGHPSQTDLPVSFANSAAGSIENAMAVSLDGKASSSSSQMTATEVAQFTFSGDNDNASSSSPPTGKPFSPKSLAGAGLGKVMTKITEEEDRRKSTGTTGGPYRFTFVTVATKMRPDGFFCSYQEELVMKRGSVSARGQ